MNQKSKTKNKLVVGIIIALICLIVIFLSIAGYAYAKYLSRVQETANAQVAKWSFKVNGSSSETQSFNLDFTVNKYNHVETNKVAPRNGWLF